MLIPTLRFLVRPFRLAAGLFWYLQGISHGKPGEAAFRAFDGAIRLGMRSHSLRIARGDCLNELGRVEDTEIEFSESLLLKPHHLPTLKKRAQARAKLGLLEEAEEDFDTIEMLCPNDADVPFQRGMMLYDAGEYSRAAERRPRDRNILLWRGASYCNLGMYDLALDDLAGVIASGGGDAADYRWRGQAHACLREFEAALADFDKAIRIDPNVAQAHSWRGWILFELGRWKDARHAYDEAIRLDPNTRHYYEQRSKTWDRLGRDDLAAADFELVEELELKAHPPLTDMNAPATDLYSLVRAHFSDTPLEQLSLTERFFPARQPRCSAYARCPRRNEVRHRPLRLPQVEQ